MKLGLLLAAAIRRATSASLARPSSVRAAERRGMLSQLTMSLSGRTHTRPARRERKRAKRARGAPTTSYHGTAPE